MFFKEIFPAHKTISWRYKWTQILQSAWKSRAILELLKILPEIRSGTFTILAARSIMFFVAEENPEDFAKYEAEFPYKEKLVLPGQLE